MQGINELKTILQKFFSAHKSRMTCMVNMIFALFSSKTVNLVELSCAFHGKAETASKYKRLQRFCRLFSGFTINSLAAFISAFLPDGPWQLSMDRTNWQCGKKNVNILILSANIGKVSIPVCWQFLDKKGISNQKERSTLIRLFITAYGKHKLGELLADREFVSEEWFKWLVNRDISFTIRVKKNFKVASNDGNQVQIHRLFRSVGIGKSTVLKTQYTVLGVPLWLAMHRRDAKEMVIVATTEQPRDALNRYKKRWNIENLFGFLKSKGFNFEDTRITHHRRLHNLFSVLVIAFILSYRTGESICNENPVVIKNHGRPSKSIFRVGLDHLRSMCCQLNEAIIHHTISIIDALSPCDPSPGAA